MNRGTTFVSWIALTLIYPPPGTTVYVRTETITFFGPNITTATSKGSVVQMGTTRLNVKETPEEILKLVEKAKGGQ